MGQATQSSLLLNEAQNGENDFIITTQNDKTAVC